MFLKRFEKAGWYNVYEGIHVSGHLRQLDSEKAQQPATIPWRFNVHINGRCEGHSCHPDQQPKLSMKLQQGGRDELNFKTKADSEKGIKIG